MSDYFGKETFKLGFGLMRLPRLDGGGRDGAIDVEQTKKMVDAFLEAGGTYFDTAYVYGGSEDAIRQALVERYPRDKYTLATKLNAGFFACKTPEDARAQFDESLKRTGAGYFDFYLLHALGDDNYKKYEEFDLWTFVKELKAAGKIRHIGFSFHGTPGVLDMLLNAHPEVEFVQLQLNYADWESPSVQSRANYETARAHGKSIVVMEPVKGGALATPPQSVLDIFHAADPDASPASWAIRFIASKDGILTVLSGMSNIAQMEDNLSYMRNFKPLDAAEEKVLSDAQDALSKVDSIQCTGCSYCTPGCPMNIAIPRIFGAMNKYLIYGQLESARGEYGWSTSGGGKASDCIACGQCESACPQNLPIIDLLVRCKETLE